MEIKKYINNNNKYNIIPDPTFTLPQTLNKIKQTNFKPNDRIIIHILTNDARQTKNRNRRSPEQTRQLQTQIIQHLLKYIPRQNITLLESPPLLDSPHSDIFPYNYASVQLSRQFGTRFADTLIGEKHLGRDGFHILPSARHLLLKSVAAAIGHFSPHQKFGHARPPFGEFGPWAAPNGHGVFPPQYRHVAMAQPIVFRRRPPIVPLMSMNFQRPF